MMGFALLLSEMEVEMGRLGIGCDLLTEVIEEECRKCEGIGALG